MNCICDANIDMPFDSGTNSATCTVNWGTRDVLAGTIFPGA